MAQPLLWYGFFSFKKSSSHIAELCHANLHYFGNLAIFVLAIVEAQSRWGQYSPSYVSMAQHYCMDGQA